VHALGIALPLGLGIFRLSRRRNDRFAWLLVATGVLWSLTTLAESNSSVLYSTGRVATWLVDLALVVLLLSFPFGRLQSARDRQLALAMALVIGVLFVPTALFAQFPEPNPWASCDTSCPSNAFALTSETPAWVDELLRPLREVLTVLIYAGVAFVLVQRTRRAGSLMRHVLAPVAAIAAFRVVALAAYFAARAVEADSQLLDVAGWLYMLTLALIAASFAIGLLLQRLFVADALERITLGLREHSNARALRTALGQALGDPSLQISYWVRDHGGRWVDEVGWPKKPPQEKPGRAVTEVRVDGRRLAAITHDAGLDPLVVQAAGAHAVTTLENDRLVAQLHTSLDELERSRARIAAVADRERRKIERDLHDGAQQRLVALRIKLELIAESLEGESPGVAAAIRRLEGDVDTTIDEVRSFARGIYPPTLAQHGLSEALRVAGRAAAIPTTVVTTGVERHSAEIEATVYFACMEALQNAAKHAQGATGVSIELVEDGALHFEVSDNGQGFAVPTSVNGSGLTNLRDRVAAAGGHVTVRSELGRGTTITGNVPTEQ
jgi:signal transduction histidine kinase